jgi:hypothetical protein
MSRNFKSNLENTLDPSLEPHGEVANSIALFRTAVHFIAERETARPLTAEWLAPARRRHRAAQRRMVLAWACAVVLCFAVVPLSLHAPHATKSAQFVHAPSVQPSTEESDTALLEQVDTEIAEPVPSSLAPLTELDSWNSSTSNTESSLHTTEKKNVAQ